jgi:hypothetical protein
MIGARERLMIPPRFDTLSRKYGIDKCGGDQ